jgi:hypothetical protein
MSRLFAQDKVPVAAGQKTTFRTGFVLSAASIELFLIPHLVHQLALMMILTT